SRTMTAIETQAGTPRQRVIFHEVSGGYFEALGIPIAAGRNFDAGDAGRPVLIFNQAAARRFWPGENPVGKTIVLDERPHPIIGLPRDAHTTDLNSVDPTMYQPISGRVVPQILVRDPAPGTIDRIGAIVKQLEPRAELQSDSLSHNFRQQIQPSII